MPRPAAEYLLGLRAHGNFQRNFSIQRLDLRPHHPTFAVKTSTEEDVRKSSPSRSNFGSSATSTIRYKSEPSGPAPATRTFEPVLTPAGDADIQPTVLALKSTGGAVMRLIQTNGDGLLIGGGGARPVASLGAAHPAEDGTEEVGEVILAALAAEDVARVAVLDVDPARRTGGARLTAEPLAPVEVAGRAAALLPVGIGATELVVARAFLRVAQHLVGLIDLLELVLGLLVAGVPVRMIFHGQLAIRLADVVSVRGAFQTENLVVILVVHTAAFYAV